LVRLNIILDLPNSTLIDVFDDKVDDNQDETPSNAVDAIFQKCTNN